MTMIIIVTTSMLHNCIAVAVVVVALATAAASTLRGADASISLAVENDDWNNNNNNNNNIDTELDTTPPIFGTQCSFAITGPTLDGCTDYVDTSGHSFPSRQEFYNDHMAGCYQYYNEDDCLESDQGRLAMNQRQPQSMINMTSTGYHKVKAPESLRTLLTDFWNTNKETKEIEEWYDGSVFTNHWVAPTYMVSVEDDSLKGGGPILKQAIWDAALAGVEAWTGGVVKLRPVSLYGIRVYTEGAILSPHVDRVPLVSSGIVNVAQDVDEPWPLEVYDRQGHAVNITMEPGDMILYESHSLIHGRPFPLRGRYYANVFIHFEPFEGWEGFGTGNHPDESNSNSSSNSSSSSTLVGGELPPYIVPGSPEAAIFRNDNPHGWSKYFAEGEEPPISTYASDGNLEQLRKWALLDPRLMWFADDNGWTPLHESVRAGQLKSVEYLLDHGAGINELTHDGSTPLRIAINYLGNTHEITQLLKDLDADDQGDADIDDDFDPEHDDDVDDDGGDDKQHGDEEEENENDNEEDL